MHLKGFARDVDFDDPHIKETSKTFVQCIIEWQPARIVWDGDPFRDDSFTKMIIEIDRVVQGGVDFVAFIEKCDMESFCRSWSATGIAISLCICKLKDTNDWAEIGTYALSVTGATTVMCLGGGKTLKEEKNRCPNVEFNMFPISRSGEHAVVL